MKETMNLKSEWAKLKAWMIQFLLRFIMDTRAEGSRGKIGDWIGLTITLIFGVILTPIIVDQVQSANTSSWTFTGASGAKTLFLILPFIFIVGLIVYFIGRLLGKI